MSEDEKVYVVVSSGMVEEMKRLGLGNSLIIYEFVEPNRIVIVKSKDFDKVINDGVWFERRDDGIQRIQKR